MDSQYGIGSHACSSMASIAARILVSCLAVIENRTSNFTAVLSIALEQNAESARTVNSPVAPACRMRLIVSVRKLFAPRAAPAAPPRSRENSTCPVSAQVASCG